jgi:nucleotide-binding universal stress UspA family protein
VTGVSRNGDAPSVGAGFRSTSRCARLAGLRCGSRGNSLIRRILHPTDFSPASRPAFKEALDLAKMTGARLFLLHVLPALPVIPDVYIAPTTFDELQRGQRDGAQKQLLRLLARAKAARVRASGILREVGAAHEQIVRVARSKRVGLIAMGTHGRGGIARALLGSVAERVVRTASCPVLTVRAK